MPNVRYTRQMLADAVAASTSVAGVMRQLGLRPVGGHHTHISRRIKSLGIDTSHFLGQGHRKSMPSRNRLRAEDILILKASDARREKPHRLRRALAETGRRYECEGCGLGDEWNGRRLTLHVDHIDGRLWDCRAENLRFLCPNCHSQTDTFAGRSRSKGPHATIRVDDQGNPLEDSVQLEPLTEAEQEDVVSCFARGEIGASAAARRLGCDRSRVYKLRQRLRERGSLATIPRRPPLPLEAQEAIIAFALDHPEMGARRIARSMSSITQGRIDVPVHTVGNTLARAGLTKRTPRPAKFVASD